MDDLERRMEDEKDERRIYLYRVVSMDLYSASCRITIPRCSQGKAVVGAAGVLALPRWD